LYVSNSVKIAPIVFGENQEQNKRGGTANTAGIVGFGKACEIAMRDMRINNHKVRSLSEYFTTKLSDSVENIVFNINTRQKLPQIISVKFVGVDGESLSTKLNINGIAASTYGDSTSISNVLNRIGLSNEDSKCSIRLSIGKNNSYEEIDRAIALIAKSVEELREFSSTYGMKIRKRKGDNR